MNNRMHITRLLLVETGTYNDLYMRPYTTHLNQDSLRSFTEATHGGALLEPGNIASVSGLILRPSTEARGQIHIPNGFNTKRFRFMMEVVIDGNGHFGTTQQVQYLCGYTDQADVTMNNTLDPRMRLYFNSSVLTRRTSQNTPMGLQTLQTGREASHVLTNRNDFVPGFGEQNQSLHMMRPSDVFYRMGVNAGASMGNTQRVDTTYDFRSILHAGKINKSKRSNTNTSTYLSSILTNYRDMVSMADPSGDYGSIMADAGGRMNKETLMTEDPFLGSLLAHRYTSFMEGGSITYQELCNLSPSLDSLVDVITQRGNLQMMGGAMDRGSTEHWKGTNNETVMATIVTQSVPALMMDLMLTKVAFMATNKTLDGQFMVQLTGGQSFAENLDLTPYLMSFQTRLRDEVLRELSQNNLIEIDLQCEIDLLGDSKVGISSMGGPMIPFVMPSFCDALTVPVIAPDAKTLELLSHDIAVLGENIATDYSLPAQHFGIGGSSGPSFGTNGYNNANSSVL